MMITDNYTILIQKLDEFIRKYYKNLLVRGLIYTFAALLVFYLLTNTIEYFARLEPLSRSILFYIFLLINGLIVFRLIILPLFKLWRIGRLITHEQASLIIGQHFPNVKDRLLNTLQLNTLRDYDLDNSQLIEASINQKIEELRPIPFQKAIDLKKNQKYLRFAIPPLVIFFILLFAAPSFITEPTQRLIHHNVYYTVPSPFEITLLNKELKGIQQEDFQLDIRVRGAEVPENLFIEYENARFGLTKESNTLYHYRFKNLQKNIVFQVTTDDFRTEEYELTVIPKPIVLNFEVKLVYPAYIHKMPEKLVNTGDLLIPCGTQIQWRFYTRDTRKIQLRFRDKVLDLNQKESNAFDYSTRFLESQPYSITSFNEYLKNQDSLTFMVNVIPDVYPSINVEEFNDSVYEKRLYFSGLVKDDYGFNKLAFHYRLLKGGDSLAGGGDILEQNIPVNASLIQQNFYHFFDLSSLELKPGDGVEYYFVIWDNDGVNGSKSTRSQKMFFKAPTVGEMNEKTEKANDKLKDDMQEAIRDAKNLQKKVEELNRKLLDKKEIGYQEKKQLQDMLKEQQELQEKVQQINKDHEENGIREQQYKDSDERLLEKQKQLEDLFNDVLNDEMKKMIEDMQKMLENIDKNKMGEMLDKIKMNSDDLEKQLDRELELFKQLEFEKKMDEVRQQLDELQKDQEKLGAESEKKEADSKELQEKQDELNKEFKQFMKDMDDLEKKNKELEDPNQMMNTKEDQQDIQNDMQNGSESLKKKQNQKASKSQKSAAKKMKQLGEKMDQMQMDMEGGDMEQDMRSLRQILEDLVQVSFDQEALMLRTNKVRTYDPQYLKMIQEQKNLKDNLALIEDSLVALGKRQAAVKASVTREITVINNNVEKALEEMTERRTSTASGKQQYVMTGVNNLALLLQENMNQMQMQMQSADGSGKAGCGKGGKGKGNMKSMKQLQEQLNKQLEELGKAMKQGQPKPGQGQQSISEQLARAAAQQEAIRRQLQQLRDEIAKEGKGNTGTMNQAIQQMEQTEADLVNKRITEQTLMRQKEILTRLLESEKAEREREKEEKRESTEAKNQNYSNPKSFFEYNKIKNRETELLKTVPPTLKPFYKNKVNEYFFNFED